MRKYNVIFFLCILTVAPNTECSFENCNFLTSFCHTAYGCLPYNTQGQICVNERTGILSDEFLCHPALICHNHKCTYCSEKLCDKVSHYCHKWRGCVTYQLQDQPCDLDDVCAPGLTCKHDMGMCVESEYADNDMSLPVVDDPTTSPTTTPKPTTVPSATTSSASIQTTTTTTTYKEDATTSAPLATMSVQPLSTSITVSPIPTVSTTTAQKCDTDSNCHSSTHYCHSSGACMIFQLLGQSCKDDRKCLGPSVCGKASGVCEECREGLNCPPNGFCHSEYGCTPFRKDGELCDAEARCRPGLTCIDGSCSICSERTCDVKTSYCHSEFGCKEYRKPGEECDSEIHHCFPHLECSGQLGERTCCEPRLRSGQPFACPINPKSCSVENCPLVLSYCHSTLGCTTYQRLGEHCDPIESLCDPNLVCASTDSGSICTTKAIHTIPDTTKTSHPDVQFTQVYGMHCEVDNEVNNNMWFHNIRSPQECANLVAYEQTCSDTFLWSRMLMACECISRSTLCDWIYAEEAEEDHAMYETYQIFGRDTPQQLHYHVVEWNAGCIDEGTNLWHFERIPSQSDCAVRISETPLCGSTFFYNTPFQYCVCVKRFFSCKIQSDIPDTVTYSFDDPGEERNWFSQSKLEVKLKKNHGESHRKHFPLSAAFEVALGTLLFLFIAIVMIYYFCRKRPYLSDPILPLDDF